MARRVRARCPNDVRAREETTSGAVVVLAKGDVTDRTGDDDFKRKGKDVSLTLIKRNGINGLEPTGTASHIALRRTSLSFTPKNGSIDCLVSESEDRTSS